jgi:hypothetical protein
MKFVLCGKYLGSVSGVEPRKVRIALVGRPLLKGVGGHRG